MKAAIQEAIKSHIEFCAIGDLAPLLQLLKIELCDAEELIPVWLSKVL